MQRDEAESTEQAHSDAVGSWADHHRPIDSAPSAQDPREDRQHGFRRDDDSAE